MTTVVDLWFLLGNLHRFKKDDSPTPSRPAGNNEKHTIQWSHKPLRAVESRYCAIVLRRDSIPQHRHAHY